MSLKPAKISDMNKDWMKKRQGKERKISPEYHLIVTEGTKTEPNYFESLQKKINEKYPERIQLDISGTGYNTVSLFDRAKDLAEKNLNQYKHVWIVYDTDDFPPDHINLVPLLCKNNSTSECQYHAIWSNQCIELWFLLHFNYLDSNITREEYCSKLNGYLKNLSKGKYKKNREDIFEILFPYIDTAIENAKKLEIQNKNKSPSDSVPGTKMYQLFEKLRNFL